MILFLWQSQYSPCAAEKSFDTNSPSTCVKDNQSTSSTNRPSIVVKDNQPTSSTNRPSMEVKDNQPNSSHLTVPQVMPLLT